MPKLYLVRHAEPDALWGAHPDPGLSLAGRGQALAVGAHLAGLDVSHLITSPMARCRQTAAPTETALSQIALINQAVAEIPVPDDVANHRAWLAAVMSGKWTDGHIGSDLVAWRSGVAAALLALGQDTIIFSHFVAINAAVGAAMAVDEVVVFKPGHASITVLESKNDALHIIELGQESAINLA